MCAAAVPIHPPATRIRRRIRLATTIAAVVAAAAAPAPLRAQAGGAPPERRFAVRQISYWLPAGWDSSTVCAAETLFVLTPTDATGLTAREVKVYVGSDGSMRGSLARRSSAQGSLKLEPFNTERHDWFGYPEPSDALESGSMMAEGGLWVSGRPRAARRAWVDTVRLLTALPDDTVEIRQVRAERRVGTRTIDGVRWVEIRAEVRATIATAVRVEQHLEAGGVRAAAALSGLVRERYLYDSATGRTDSLESDGRLSGAIAFTHASGRTDTLRGTWVFRRRGSWRESGAAARTARLEYFMVHGRDSAGRPPDAFARTGESLQAARLDADSLAALRARTASPFDRFAAEEGLRAAHFRNDSLITASLEARPVRSHDALRTASGLRGYRYRHGQGLDEAWADAVAALLPDERLQREMVLDREELLSGVLTALHSAGRVPASAGPALLASARRAADPLGRDLLLLAAYAADPAAALPLLEQLADGAEGYGPIARRYVAGDASGFNESWGIRRGAEEVDTAQSFPGLATDAAAHAAYQRAPEAFSIRAVELWFAARGLDAIAELRRRFAAAPTDSERVVWAGYLMALRDTAPLAWLRDTTVVRSAAVAEQVEALQRIAPEPVTDETIIRGLQDLAILHATGGEILDTLGSPIHCFSAHDEGSGDWFLVSDSLLPAVLARWDHHMTVVSRDSLKALAQRDGQLRMGLVVTPPVRLGRRYAVDVMLLPFLREGEACLCGGGSELLLERRGGGWRVVGMSAWIS